MMKTLRIAFLLFCALVLLAVPVLTLASATAEPVYSLYENRNLAGRPGLTLSGLLSGEYFEAWEAYLRDRVWQRDRLLRADAALQTALSRPFVNDVLVSDEALLPYVTGIDPGSVAADAARMADALSALSEQVAAYGGVFLYVGVPNQYSACRAGYPDYMDYVGEGLDAARDAFFAALDERGVAWLDMNEVFADPAAFYFHTDHHMDLPGSVETCRAIFDALRGMGIEIPDHLSDVTYRALPNPFYGSRGRKLYGLGGMTEELLVYDRAPEVAYSRRDYDGTENAPLIALPETGSEPVSYGIFTGGDMAETVITTDRPALSSALIFGDSYTNTIETAFYTGFDETRSLDLRYYGDVSLSDYLAQHRPRVVVCVRDDANYLNFTGNGNLHGDAEIR